MRLYRAAGFTLVETLVAMTLLALLFGALLPVFQNGLAVLARGDQQVRAVQLAQSLLARDAANLPIDAGTPAPLQSSGEEEGYAWTVTREPYVADDEILPLEARSGWMLVRVSALVTWEGNAHGLHLSTLTLERAP
jgi:prepilin-type N-terminal cleavage/methylation domain-containing protein